ncbi:MAG: long-chain fatty acid--CoA ligase [Candidatus Eremiobacteraeota bacterium]|nr:long-chain fatty acid--CoA ligase [Candidatus Eremiobacteraeota bacterium]
MSSSLPPSELPSKETLPHLIRRALSEPREDALVERVNGTWTPMSSARVLERVENVACAIRDAGLGQGDRVALIAHDCIDWVICDFATFFAGCVVVPIYPTQALDHTAFILEHAEAKLLFVDSASALQRLREGNIALPPTVVFESEGADSLDAFERRGADVRRAHPELPGGYYAQLKPEDLAVLIYTSGTTGAPKGVMLSHDNLGFDAQSSLQYGLDELHKHEPVLSVLPFSHIYEHTMIYIYLLAGMRYNICHDPNDLLADMRDTHPTVITAVPRIFDRVLAGIQGQALKHGGLQAKLVPWALRVGREYMTAKTFEGGAPPALALQYAIAKRLVLDKVRKMLGLENINHFLSGSAALHVDVAMTFLAIGVPIMQGYGLTETSPVLTTSTPANNKYGAVGRPIPGCEVKIAEDGEVLARGRNIMMGYYRDPEATAAALAGGWFHTGDIGEVDADGYLRITDRKKEVFKTATGKYVSPARVEAAIKRSMFVAQAMVIGDNRPHPAALVAPNWDLLRVELSLPALTPEELAERPDVIEFMTAEVRKQTSDLASYEQIRRIAVLPREFSVENGELSPSMKIKRRVVEGRYKASIDRAYAVDLHAHSA